MMKPTTVALVATSPDTEYSKKFLQGMLNRMSVSFHKYGKVADAYPHKVSALDSLQQRIDSYRETGNTEYLIDVSNFGMIEFMQPSVEGAFFEGTDSDGSPGRTAVDGSVSTKRNDKL